MSKHTGEAWVSSFAAGSNGPALFTTVEGKNVRLANFVEATEADRRLAAASPDLLTALQGLFEHCVMIHKHWGEGSNQKEADAAIAFAKTAIDKAEETT